MLWEGKALNSAGHQEDGKLATWKLGPGPKGLRALPGKFLEET